MSDLRTAILNGAYAAGKVHQELNSYDAWEHGGGRIDVFGAIDKYDLPLMFQPLDGLLGAYLAKPTPGILVTTQRPMSVRRYTAAHELGHFRLSHTPSLDDEEMIIWSPFSNRRGYELKEVEANAFAIAFLLPQWLVAGQMRRHGWKPADMGRPTNVYQLALRAGLSYEATCYSLKTYNVINATTCGQLMQVEPKKIKQSLVPDYQPRNWRLDVWHLEAGDDGLFVDALPGDIIDVSLPEHSGGGYKWEIDGLKDTDLKLISDDRSTDSPQGVIGGHVTRKVTALAAAEGLGSVQFVERRSWERETEPLTTYRFSYDISEVGKKGLLPTQRARLMVG